MSLRVRAAGLKVFMVSINDLGCQLCIGCSLSLCNIGTKLCVITDIFVLSYLLIAQSLLTESSKISCPQADFFLSIRSSSVSYVRALYTGASQYIANRSDSSLFVVGF